MSKSIRLLSFFMMATITNTAVSQENNFVIGIQGVEYLYTNQGDTVRTPKFRAAPYSTYYSSAYSVLQEDGFNLARVYLPNLDFSRKKYRAYILLAKNNGIQILDDNEGWYKSAAGAPTNGILVNPSGINVYDWSYMAGHTNDACFNYDRLYAEVYNHPTVKSNIYGHMITGESNFYHWKTKNAWPPNTTYTSTDWTYTEVNPANVSAAFLYFKPFADALGQHLLQVQATHSGTTSATTTDDQGVYNVAQYLQIPNRGSVFLEGSYFADNWVTWYTGNSNYLGKYKSIDFAKQYYDKVLVEIDLSYDNSAPYYNAGFIWHTNTAVPNANNIWFQTYLSIIHGAEGAIFWGLGYSYDPTVTADVTAETNLHDPQISANNYQFANFSAIYKNCISNLSKELRYLKEMNLLSDDRSTIVWTKTGVADPYCILPVATAYLDNPILAADARDLNKQVGRPFSEGITNTHRTEEFGIRYTVRTNGDEVVVIASNPNPYSVHDVAFDFNNVANAAIRNSTGAEMLFQQNLAVNATNYNTDRNWIPRATFAGNISTNLPLITAGLRKYSLAFTSSTNRTLTMDFGPLDVRVFRFVKQTPVPDTYWKRSWTNNGSGSVVTRTITDLDKLVAADFDADGTDELLVIQGADNNAVATMMDYNMTTDKFDQVLWQNQGTDGLGFIKWHGIKSYDNYVAGDFTGDGKDELMGIQKLSSGAWSTLIGFNPATKLWDNWYWANNDHEGLGKISTHVLQSTDKFVAGDFTGDGKDELLVLQSMDLNAKASLFGFNAVSGTWNAAMWTNSNTDGLGWIKWHGIKTGDRYFAGDFTGDEKEELLGIQTYATNSWATMIGYNPTTNLWDNWIWANNDHEGVGKIGNWTLNATDNFVVGDFNGDTKDDILCIRAGATGTLARLMTYNSGWVEVWSSGDQKIYDWAIANGAGTNEKYLPFALENAEGETQSGLLALRKFKCNVYESSLLRVDNGFHRQAGSIEEETMTERAQSAANERMEDVVLFPNPNNGLFEIRGLDETTERLVEISDLSGKIVYSGVLLPSETAVQLDNAARNGIYLVRITQNDLVIFKKFALIAAE